MKKLKLSDNYKYEFKILESKTKFVLNIFLNFRHELVLECGVEGGYNNATLTWWIDDVKYDNKLDMIIQRDLEKDKPRKLINRIVYR